MQPNHIHTHTVCDRAFAFGERLPKLVSRIVDADGLQKLEKIYACLTAHGQVCSCNAFKYMTGCACGHHVLDGFDAWKIVAEHLLPGVRVLNELTVFERYYFGEMNSMRAITLAHIDIGGVPDMIGFTGIMLNEKMGIDESMYDAVSTIALCSGRATLPDDPSSALVTYKYSVPTYDIIFGFQTLVRGEGVIENVYIHRYHNIRRYDDIYTYEVPRITRDGYFEVAEDGPLAFANVEIYIMYNRVALQRALEHMDASADVQGNGYPIAVKIGFLQTCTRELVTDLIRAYRA